MVGAKSMPFRVDADHPWVHHECIVFPWLSLDGSSPATSTAPASDADSSAAAPDVSSLRARRVKYRSIDEKACQLSQPAGGERGFFGMHTVPASATSVVITEGELDAMSVRQATGAYAVSLPNGARSLPVEARALHTFARACVRGWSWQSCQCPCGFP